MGELLDMSGPAVHNEDRHTFVSMAPVIALRKGR